MPADRGRLRWWVAIAAPALLLAGCGYSLRGTLPEDIRTVGVPVLANRTQEPAAEEVVTRAIIDAFTTDGRLRVVRPENADAVLEGEVVGYELQPLAFDRTLDVQQYRLVVTLNVRLRVTRTGELLFEEQGVRERADFRATESSVTLARESGALRQAATDIGRAVVSLALQRF
jgi:outer membrane lipopolysaccharide assembly protein LptE/RlpB